MPDKIMIIKLDALGDVLRTTPILRRLEGEITWVTRREAMPLLEGNPFIDNIVDINKSGILKEESYDLLINADEADEACSLASGIKAGVMVGAYMENDKKCYTPSAASWFDMSLISKHGLKKANQIKRSNIKSYQEHLFDMAGLKFSGEEYVLNFPQVNDSPYVIGIEKNAGQRWPMKRWSGYEKLAEKLTEEGFKVRIFEWRSKLIDYIADISMCGVVVGGDTLAMHVALGLKKKVVALFGPTSAEEIFAYSRMAKIKTATPCYCCYKRDDYSRKVCIDAIEIRDVYLATRKIANEG